MMPFDKLGTAIKQYALDMEIIDASREERRRLQAERAISEDINNAYELVDRTAGYMEFPA